MGFFAALGALVLFATSAAAGDAYANVHSVGIVSVMNDSISMSRDSLLGTERDVCLIDISDWSLDDAITQRIAALLPPRFAVKSVTVDKSAIYSLGRLGSLRTRNLLRALTSGNGVDALIVVSPRHLTASTGLGRGPDIFGLTVLNRLIGGPGVFALYQIGVFDTKSGEQIGFAFGHTGVGILGFTEVVQDVDKSYWSETVADFSAEQKQKLKSVVFDITLNSLPYALYTADLIPEIPKSTPHP
jgi:hypothetical protein